MNLLYRELVTVRLVGATVHLGSKISKSKISNNYVKSYLSVSKAFTRVISKGWHYRDTPFAYIDTPQIAR